MSSSNSDETNEFEWVTVDEAADSDSLPAFELQYTIQDHADRPDHCTIYPHDASDDGALTQWISADEGSFVDGEEMR